MMRWFRTGGRDFGKTAALEAERRLAEQKREVGPDGWTCHVCGDYRPDARISVHTTTVTLGVEASGGEYAVEAKQNVRYCNDRPACVEGAADVKLIRADGDA